MTSTDDTRDLFLATQTKRSRLATLAIFSRPAGVRAYPVWDAARAHRVWDAVLNPLPVGSGIVLHSSGHPEMALMLIQTELIQEVTRHLKAALTG